MVLPVALPLVPTPHSAIAGEGLLTLDPNARVHGPPAAASVLIEAVARRTGIRLGTAAGAADITLRVDADAAASEGYTLVITDGIEVVGADDAGLYYGVQTLLQLLREADAAVGGEVGWGWQRAEIADAPRFAYRGVMLDVTRHFFPVDEVKTVIDRAAALKFNHVHLHLTDDQGWRLQIDAWPLLAEKASTSAANGDTGGFYTKDDFRGIVAHAASRHVTIVPEIDLPGHTHAIGVAYPDLVEAPVISDALAESQAQLGQDLPIAGVPFTGYGVGHSSVRIREERTYDFVRDVLAELSELTPGPYLHIGGDESLGTTPEDFAYFVERASAMVTELGKTPIAWHEAGAAEQIAEGTVGQFWGSTTPSETHAAEAEHFVTRGGTLILSPSNAVYLDMKYDADFPLGLSWAGLVDVRRAYEWEPTELLGVPAEAILGVEAPLWTETVRRLTDADQLMYPRIAAAAEQAWTAVDAAERNWDSFRARVGAMAPMWQADGIRFHPTPEIDWNER
ncbi:family 20 glycosylhydrolase [Microbacterium sp. H1-D42]|uniref:family 20 glycosylhydrolase n=1 Tax=Microbacterium sp. H1-D42 TaxID=2925844 RepID=UPI001F530B50|nr:family 20 glycosylhydrolase [Microbacterium sp. H1-D42]UNK70005.1 beta-N-acetylhexosaminidase [Microbacterium sp. H1-D42]